MSQEQKTIDVNPDINTVDRPAVEDPVESAAGAEHATFQDLSGRPPADSPAARPDEQPAAPVSLDHDTLARLQNALEQALSKAQENWNLYLAARAEAENVRKRNERELQNTRKYILKEFIDALLPVKDSLEMGIAAAADATDLDKLREGSELTLKLLNTVIEKFGVQEINPLGEKFNPDLHQAMAMQPSDQAEPNTVLHVIQKGYLLNERLIRPALVIVAQAAQPRSA